MERLWQFLELAVLLKRPSKAKTAADVCLFSRGQKAASQLKPFHELRNADFETLCEHIDGANAGLFAPVRELADIDSAQARQLS